MFDMMKAMENAKTGDKIVLKKLTEITGCIISADSTLYFIELNQEKQYVQATLDQAGVNKVNLPLRSIWQIITQDGTLIYQADWRDMVYGF